MTREEAVEIINDVISEGWLGSVFDTDACKMAIEALKQEPCEDCVSRKAVLDLATTIETDDYSGNEIFDAIDAEDVKKLPPVMPKQKMGHWIMLGEKEEIYCEEAKCSICGLVEVNAGYDDYCPNCGAKMERGDRE